MTIHVKQAPNGLWRWSVIGEDERVPEGVGWSDTEHDARFEASRAIDADTHCIAAMTLPTPYRWNSWVSVIYPVGDIWRWVIIMLNRPIYGGACDTYAHAEYMTFFAMQHAFRPWGDYDRPYTDEFAGGELLDPLTVNAQKES